MWGATLSVSYPVVKILLENQTLGEHVQNLIAKCERQIHHSKSDLKDYEVRQLDVDEAGAPSMERKMFRAETKITSARKNLARLRWIEFFVVPRLPSDRFLMFTLILVLLLVVTLLKLVCMFAEE